MPESRHSLMSHFDPDPPVGFLQSCPTLSPGLFVFRIHEAAARDLRQPAEAVQKRALALIMARREPRSAHVFRF